MLVAAIIIGALTAYYFGLRPGAYAAAGSAGLMFLGLVVPGKMFLFYGLVAVYTAGVLIVGPRLPAKESKKQDFLRLGRKAMGKGFGFYRSIRNRFDK